MPAAAIVGNMRHMDDEQFRMLLLAVILIGGALATIGGFAKSVAGTWIDGPRRIVLRQYGPILRGDGSVDGGKQVYRGWVLFGHLHLTRYDFGGTHLGMLGFSHEQWPALHGKEMARYRLVLQHSGDLLGEFRGRRFSFMGAKVTDSALIEPAVRTWVRPDNAARLVDSGTA